MPFQKGQSGNPQGGSRADREAITKIRKSISLAIDKMRNGKSIGIVAFQEKMAESLETDFLATLKAVAPLLPKDVMVESLVAQTADKLTDAELADIIATRARQKHLDNQTLEAEYTEVEEGKG
jgi:hypothetical protein